MEAQTPEQIATIVLLDIALIVVVARLIGVLFRRFRQPAVVAEIAAALILGPSLLGALPGNPTEFLFPLTVRPYLAVIATLGLVIFMFIVGLELDLRLIRGKGRVAATISICSVVLPFALGALLALWLHKSHAVTAGQRVDLLPFALFIGAAMSVTAFPVLARLLSERGMSRIPTGALALACAAVDDVLAWTMLAGVLAIVNSTGALDTVSMMAQSLAFLAVMFLIVKPRLRALVRHRQAAGRLTPDVFAVVLVGVLVASFTTSMIGIHAIFGAFLFGAIMPREDAAQLSHEILERVEQLTVLVLLPVFFIVTGLNVDISGLGREGLVELAAVLGVACAGKFLGAMLGARAVGVPPRRAGALGVLMNARGLTELVILNIGHELHVLDDRLFTVMVLMALITTAMTEPLLRLFYTDRMIAREAAEAERQALGLAAEYRVVAAVRGPDDEHTVDVSVAMLGDEASSQLLISRFDPPFETLEVGSGLTAELAAIAASFESLQTLSQRATDAGASVVVRSQFSEDVAADLATQLQVADADLVVISLGTGDVASEIAAVAECAVVLVVLAQDPTTDPAVGAGLLDGLSGIGVLPGAGDDGLAAVEHACRAALRSGVALTILARADRRDQRRGAALLRRLVAAGLPVPSAPTGYPGTPDPDTLLVMGATHWRGLDDGDRSATNGYRAVLVVRSAMEDHGQGLSDLLRERGPASTAATTITDD